MRFFVTGVIILAIIAALWSLARPIVATLAEHLRAKLEERRQMKAQRQRELEDALRRARDNQ